MSDQRSLFDLDPLPWENDAQNEQFVATVVFPDGPPKGLDYIVPDALRDRIETGRRVRAPLGKGNRPRLGYCVELATKPAGPRRLKVLLEVVDERSLLAPPMLHLTRWIAEHYLCDWSQVLEAVVPMGVKKQAGTRMATLLSVPRETAAQLDTLKLTPQQGQILKILAAAPGPMTTQDLAAAAGCNPGPIATLRKKGLIVAELSRVAGQRRSLATLPQKGNLELNASQQAALQAIVEPIEAHAQRTILVHGVTGSGKTEVYIRAIQRAIEFGRQAIVLVPEISLTPQTLERFRSRFPRVAVLHSHLSDAERHWHWQQIADEQIQVVVGARSAIFAPTPRLGLIVIDEEHEASFKQDSVPRYHARDVAIARAKAENVPLVLGSATPALESWHRAQTGEYHLVEMPRRVLDRPLPRVAIVDLRSDALGGGPRGAITRPLYQAMRQALDDGGQVMLLLNRRGFSTHLQCQACGLVIRCPECEIALTHHRTKEVAMCHYCDHEIPAPTHCPKCNSPAIRYGGRGTQKLEAEVAARFPGAKCLRMDTDAMQGPEAHANALTAFREGRVQILLGTQMIAKGLDFPNVTLVGVISADTALHFPDFRAAERTFHLVTQVAGRTGRGEKGGRVIVQTLSPDNPAILAAVRHDYVGFAKQELPLRQMLGYPPFGSMVRLVIRGPKQEITQQFAEHVAGRLRNACETGEVSARIVGPAPAPFAKLRGHFRFHIQALAGSGDGLREAVRQATADLEPPEETLWMADVDPLDML